MKILLCYETSTSEGLYTGHAFLNIPALDEASIKAALVRLREHIIESEGITRCGYLIIRSITPLV